MTTQRREELRERLELLALSIGDGTQADKRRLQEIIDIAVERERAAYRDGARATIKQVRTKLVKPNQDGLLYRDVNANEIQFRLDQLLRELEQDTQRERAE